LLGVTSGAFWEISLGAGNGNAKKCEGNMDRTGIHRFIHENKPLGPLTGQTFPTDRLRGSQNGLLAW
jgi:hypothetical protein